MTLKVTPRDRLILGVFSLLLFASCYAYYRWATAPASPGRSVQPTARALQRQQEMKQPTTDVAQAPLVMEEEAIAPALPKRDYSFIAERNIFQLPSEKPKEQKPKETAKPAPARLPSPGSLSAPPPLPVTPPPPPAPSSSPQIPSRPANLTATGIVRLGEETRVLLENTQTRDTAFVRVGESAFGYQVTSAGENYVEVKQGDVAYRLTLGEGKQERKILAAGGPGAVFRPMGAPPPPPPPIEQSSRERGERLERGSSDWVLRVVDRWNQMPEFVRNRILQRVGEIWQQLPPDQQQQVLQRFREAGVNFTPPR